MKKPGEKGFKTISATEEVISFCGWDYLLRLIGLCSSNFERGLISCIFETGGRISEVIGLSRSNFDFDTHPKLIVVRNMNLLKRWRKNKETGKTTRIRAYRTFPIRLDEPLAPYVREWISECTLERPFGVSRSKAFLMVRGVGSKLGREPIPNTLKKDGSRPLYSSELAPHILRAERASQLAEDYGFEVFSLNQFFGWRPKRTSMAERYAGMGWKGLARAMGVEV